MLGKSYDPNRFRFSHDVAFVLEPREPSDPGEWNKIRNQLPSGSVLIGFNISGLLYHGGYTRSNMFALKCDYQELVFTIIERLLAFPEVCILLVPHVFLPPERLESDREAIRQVYDHLNERYPSRIFQLQREYDQNEIKCLIGKCDFFIGSRMHACIAALSQSIPAVGLAYSKKFVGVFNTLDLGHLVLDARIHDLEFIVQKVLFLYKNSGQVRSHLEERIPKVRSHILESIKKIGS